eukprot:Gb_25742 [translate_table: standard]
MISLALHEEDARVNSRQPVWLRIRVVNLKRLFLSLSSMWCVACDVASHGHRHPHGCHISPSFVASPTMNAKCVGSALLFTRFSGILAGACGSKAALISFHYCTHVKALIQSLAEFFVGPVLCEDGGSNACCSKGQFVFVQAFHTSKKVWLYFSNAALECMTWPSGVHMYFVLRGLTFDLLILEAQTALWH